MKRHGLLFLFFFFHQLFVFGQKIQYSRQTFADPYADEMQMVTNIDGYHHVLCFRAKKKPQVFIFTPQLQLLDKIELPVTVKENADVRILPFRNYYLLYLHVPGSTLHEVVEVDGDGDAKNVSDLLGKLTDSLVSKSTSTFQFVNQDNGLTLISHVYFDAIKKVITTAIQLDQDWNPRQTFKVS